MALVGGALVRQQQDAGTGGKALRGLATPGPFIARASTLGRAQLHRGQGDEASARSRQDPPLQTFVAKLRCRH